jgi:hypothetical protein
VREPFSTLLTREDIFRYINMSVQTKMMNSSCQSTILVGRSLRQGCRSGIVYGSRKDLYSFEFLDLDPYSELRIRIQVLLLRSHKKICRNILKNYIFHIFVFFSTAYLVSSSISLKLYQKQRGFEFFSDNVSFYSRP